MTIIVNRLPKGQKPENKTYISPDDMAGLYRELLNSVGAIDIESGDRVLTRIKDLAIISHMAEPKEDYATNFIIAFRGGPDRYREIHRIVYTTDDNRLYKFLLDLNSKLSLSNAVLPNRYGNAYEINRLLGQ